MSREEASCEIFFRSADFPRRKKLTVNDVPADEAGLKQLAAAGSWHAVLALAERLESKHLDPVSKFPTEASLRFTLVRVSAYIKLQMPEQAKRVVDMLGNLSDSRFSSCSPSAAPGAIRSKTSTIVPFSLFFLAATIPAMVGNASESREKLNQLLVVCNDQATSPATPSSERLQWRNRVKRVTRALAANYFESEDFSTALRMMSNLAESEINEVRHLLALQQLGCLCLRCGNNFLATEVFKTIEKTPIDEADEGRDAVDAKQFIVATNQAFMYAFYGYFTEACSIFRQLASSALPPMAAGDSLTSAVPRAVMHALKRSAANSLVACLPFLHRNDQPEMSIQRTFPTSAAAATSSQSPSSMATTPLPPIPYTTTQPIDAPQVTVALPATNVASLIQFIESAIRADPVGMIALDATLMNLCRLYELEGAASVAAATSLMDQTTTNSASFVATMSQVTCQEVLEHVVEGVRCNKEAAKFRQK